MKIKIIRIFTIITTIIFFTLSYRVLTQIYKNQRKIVSFSYNNKMEQYQHNIPINKINFSEYDHYFNIAQALLSIKVSNVIKLPKNIQYFNEKNGEKTIVLEIPKGTNILWIPSDELNDIYFGYGLHSYPTYDKGWRYAKPFIISDKQESINQLPYYFVKTKDLEAVASTAFHSTKYVMQNLQSQKISIQYGIFSYTRFIDNIFYDNGVFCSPDLLKQVWNWIDAVLLCLSIGFLFISCSLHNR